MAPIFSFHFFLSRGGERKVRADGSEALDRVLEYIAAKPFGDSGRVALTCHRENQGAIKLYKSKGFVCNGIEYDEEIELTTQIEQS